jgi:hypothetical protein
MQQLTGLNAYISQMGFVIAFYNSTFSEFVPAIMGIVQFITALYSMYYMYRIDRKKLILIGNLGMAICCFVMGIAFLFV